MRLRRHTEFGRHVRLTLAATEHVRRSHPRLIYSLEVATGA